MFAKNVVFSSPPSWFHTYIIFSNARKWIELLPHPEAQFIVPDWGDKVDYGIVLSYRPVRLHGWRAVTTTLVHSRLYTPVRAYEFGYCILKKRLKCVLCFLHYLCEFWVWLVHKIRTKSNRFSYQVGLGSDPQWKASCWGPLACSQKRGPREGPSTLPEPQPAWNVKGTV